MGLIDGSESFVKRDLLVRNLSGNDGAFIDVGQIDLQKHESGNLRMGFSHIVLKLAGHVTSDWCSLKPVLWGDVVSGDMEHAVSGNSSEDLFVIVLEHSVHLWEFVLLEFVLEGKVEFELEALLSSGRELSRLSSGVVGELNALVSGWEMDQRVEESNPMEAAFQDGLLIYILGNVVPYDGIFGGLHTFNRNGDVYNEGHESEAHRKQEASLTGTHSFKALGAIVKAFIHLGWSLISNK